MKQNAAVILLALIFVVLLAAIGVQIKLNYDNGKQTDSISALVVAGIKGDLATCERGNDSRKATVHNLRKDIATFRSDIGFARAIRQAVAPFAPIAQALDEPSQVFIDRHADAIAGKRHTIRDYIRAQASVATRPGSVVADCQKVVKTS